MAWSFIATSQNLTPDVQRLSHDTVFCFHMVQARALARYLEQGRYCDSLLSCSEAQIEQLSRLQAFSDSTARIASQRARHQALIADNQRMEIADLSLKLKTSEKQQKAERWQKRVFLISTLVLGTWLIVK